MSEPRNITIKKMSERSNSAQSSRSNHSDKSVSKISNMSLEKALDVQAMIANRRISVQSSGLVKIAERKNRGTIQITSGAGGVQRRPDLIRFDSDTNSTTKD